MMRALILAMTFLVLSIHHAEAASTVRVNIKWEYSNFGSTVEIFEVKDSPRLWETKRVKSIEYAPVSGRVDESAFTLEPGKRKRFAIIVSNKSTEPIYFFAAPHGIQPVEHSLGFKFKCLCVNHAFTVGPGETWYRIVEFHLLKEFVGRELTVTHSIIGIDKGRAEPFSKKPDF